MMRGIEITFGCGFRLSVKKKFELGHQYLCGYERRTMLRVGHSIGRHLEEK